MVAKNGKEYLAKMAKVNKRLLSLMIVLSLMAHIG